MSLRWGDGKGDEQSYHCGRGSDGWSSDLTVVGAVLKVLEGGM